MKDELSSLLKSWNPDVPASSAFRRRVWSRIESEGGRELSLAEWFAAAVSQIARPRIAGAVLAAALFGGIWVGSMTGAEGREEYLRSVNPYALGHDAR